MWQRVLGWTAQKDGEQFPLGVQTYPFPRSLCSDLTKHLGSCPLKVELILWLIVSFTHHIRFWTGL